MKFFAGMWVGPYEGRTVTLEKIKEIKDTSVVWEVRIPCPSALHSVSF